MDNEINGFTLYQEMEEDDIKLNAWDCIIDAFAYISRASYEREGVNYYPEPIELVDDSTIQHMIDSLLRCDSLEYKYIK